MLEGAESGAKGFLLMDFSLTKLVNGIEKVNHDETLIKSAIAERILKGAVRLAPCKSLVKSGS